MNEYEFGKDISEIKSRIERLEAFIGSNEDYDEGFELIADGEMAREGEELVAFEYVELDKEDPFFAQDYKWIICRVSIRGKHKNPWGIMLPFFESTFAPESQIWDTNF